VFLSYINLFRAIATLFVVVNHSIHGLQWGAEFDNLETSRLLKIVFSNAALLFVFISGFLFQHLLFKFNYRQFLISRFRLVVLPYLIVSIPAVIAWVFVFEKGGWGIPTDFYTEPWWYRAGFFYLTGQHMAPLWFIPMISIFYLLSPLFQGVDRIPWIYWTIPLFMWLSFEVPRHWNPAVNFVHFFSVYLIGMAASRHKQAVLSWCYRYRYVLLGLFVLAVTWELLQTPYTQSYFNYLNKLILCFLIIALLHHHRDQKFRVLSEFAAINFSVFFLHTYANAGMKVLFAGGPATSIDIIGNVFYQAIYAAILVAISILVCRLVKKITGQYSKYLIGS
jgi:hypothetical protein